MRIGSLFSGAGGLDIAVQAVFGGEIVWHCEPEQIRDKPTSKWRPNPALKVLAHHWPDVPNLGDITEVDWSTVEPVDVICGGFPCQDVSAAGRRAGMATHTRSGLWVHMAAAIAALRPQWVVIENVRGLLSAKAHRDMESNDPVVGDGPDGSVLRAAGAVCGDLADLLYDTSGTTLSASAIGACHRRERVFIVAYPADAAKQFGSVVAAGDGGEQTVDASGVGAGDRDSAGDFAARVRVVGRGAGPVEGVDAESAGIRWPQRESESAWVERGSDAAQRSAEADRIDPLLLPTPVAQQSGNPPEDHLRKKPGRQRVTDLAIIAENNLFETGGLLPTPTSRDHKGRNQRDDQTCLSGALLPTPSAVDGHPSSPGRHNAAGHQDTLPGVVRELLPTPSASDGDGGKTSRSGDRKDEPLLGRIDKLLPTPVGTDAASSARHTTDTGVMHSGTSLTDALRLLPTPAAADHDRRQDYARADRDGSGGDDLVTAVVKLENEQINWGHYASAIGQWERLTRPAPSPTEPNTRGNPRLSPAFSEWMMGMPKGHVTGVGIGRNDQLRIIGNGVVPLQATAALAFLLRSIVAEMREEPA